MSGIALVVLMFVLIFLGLPVTFSLLGSCLVFFLTNDLPLASFVQKMAVSMNSFSLIALPFFVLAGNLMNTGGITKRLFAFANELLGWLRGGLCYVAIVSNAIFSALSGSAMANAAGLGLMTIKEMKENGSLTNRASGFYMSKDIIFQFQGKGHSVQSPPLEFLLLPTKTELIYVQRE